MNGGVLINVRRDMAPDHIHLYRLLGEPRRWPGGHRWQCLKAVEPEQRPLPRLRKRYGGGMCERKAAA